MKDKILTQGANGHLGEKFKRASLKYDIVALARLDSW